ncbi:hypothetical protein FHS41_004589 [Streptomyces violarus]|uniref:Uncharacterized protein n=1 Tax=Streptomyces violarus TaxID=67380 RepID=A0A7W4ZSV9_9ACTN|nr:hypothetical protein [Streptomyces violarus]
MRLMIFTFLGVGDPGERISAGAFANAARPLTRPLHHPSALPPVTRG